MQNYFETLSAVREEISRRVAEAKIELVQPDFFSSAFESFASGVKYGQTVSESAEIQTYRGKPTRKYANAIITRMDGGNYELTFYVL